jgi:hypothetical protein
LTIFTVSRTSIKLSRLGSKTTRKAGGLDFRPWAEKTKSTQCLDLCGCNCVHRTRFEWQRINPIGLPGPNSLEV